MEKKVNKMYLEDTIERIKRLRNELDKNEYCIIMGCNQELTGKLYLEAESIDYAAEQCGLDRLNIDQRLIDMDDIDGLTYMYGVDVPEDHNSAEYEEWKEQEYYRIKKEFDQIINTIDDYLEEL